MPLQKKKESKFTRNCVQNWYLVCGDGGGECQRIKVLRSRVYPLGQLPTIMLDIIGIFWEIWLDIVLSTSFLDLLEQLLASKSQLIIGQKFEIILDMIGAFCEIYLDIVLNTSFFEAFRASFRVKITTDYRTKKSK